VHDPTSAGRQERGKQTLTPGFVFYTAVSGIWQTVWLEPLPEVFIQEIHMTPFIEPARLEIQVSLSDQLPEHELQVQLKEADKVITEISGSSGQKLILAVPDAHLWSPDDPFLYDLKINLSVKNQLIDSVKSYCGLREI